MSELFAIWTLDSEVKNGGFDQFFRNNGLEYENDVLSGFHRIEAENFATLTAKAIEIFKNQDPEFKTKRNPDFNDFDQEYYSLESWENLQVQYIRENYEKFVVS